MVAKYPGRAVFVSENFGASRLAERFGVRRYPAVFVDDVLVARPNDFGFLGRDEQVGRYVPWRDARSQERFKADLSRMVDLILAGRKDEVVASRAQAGPAPEEIAALPRFSLTDLAGHPLTADQVRGRPVLIEFWATWCPPCRSTLAWLGSLKQKYGDRVAVLAFAVDSPEEQVKATVRALSPGLRWAMTDAATAHAFGDIAAVPTLFLFDREGRTARILYGAPPDLHPQAEAVLDKLTR